MKRIQNKIKIEQLKKRKFYLQELKSEQEIDEMDLIEVRKYLKTITKILEELLKSK